MNINTLMFIHVGKCGGGVILDALRKHLNGEPRRFHVAKLELSKHDRYIIALRNPVTRFISAFNWVDLSPYNSKDVRDRNKKIALKYSSANNLAESLYDADGNELSSLRNYTTSIIHIREDISFYLDEIFKRGYEGNIDAVITQENLKEDCKRILGFDITDRIHSSNTTDYSLSDIAIKNIHRYFKRDYDYIDKLRYFDIITERQYNDLTRF